MARNTRGPIAKEKNDLFAQPAPAVTAGFSLPIEQVDAFSGDPDFMTSLARGLIVLQAFNQLKRPARISLLSNKTGLSRASVRRCLHTLTKLGFAASDESLQFVLLPKVLSLGYGYLSSTPFTVAVKPILDRLGGLLRESCSVSVLDGQEIVYIARASVTRIMSVDLQIGSRLPAFCTSMGRVLLASLAESELETYFASVALVQYTARTIVSVEKLRRALKSIRRNGYAIVDQELELGLRSVAVPIRDASGKVVAALNAGAHAQAVSTSELQKKFVPPLLSAAQELSMLFR